MYSFGNYIVPAVNDTPMERSGKGGKGAGLAVVRCL